VVKIKNTKKTKSVSRGSDIITKKNRKSVSKKIINRHKTLKKRNQKKNRRANRKHGFLIVYLISLKKWFRDGMKIIRKEQRHCLRFKKYKRKRAFCFVRALLIEYPWRTMSGLVLIILFVSFFVMGNFDINKMTKYFGVDVKTSLVAQLEARINSLRSQISSRKKCMEDKYWQEDPSNVCGYWLYEQNNQHCAKFNIDTKRVAMGTKMCCDSLESVVYDGPGKNVTPCPGSDIFFSRDHMHKATLVADESGCGLGACQFYPAEGYLIKFDLQGNIAYGKEGQPIVVKPCSVTRKVGACDKECGGGKRTVTGQDMYCNKFTMTEVCNIEPCFVETIAN